MSAEVVQRKVEVIEVDVAAGADEGCLRPKTVGGHEHAVEDVAGLLVERVGFFEFAERPAQAGKRRERIGQ